ncbi:ArsB/NhaD family transporter [Paenibacillus mendelii]|uniref:ArsB/NhaD family transporter n=1 Tax=Paenibacillus mendelii TaxID=206163 RepID=A0ABV6JBM1_9BACL|nr:ArsB/NhaD family transporter [Paenibacillus mendelii]MCQ6559629.1 SLC13 family permease [Paenibacillus mendelii]
MFDGDAYLAWFVMGTTIAIMILGRPQGLNESVPVTAGAVLMLAAGISPAAGTVAVSQHVGGAAVTILATTIMAIVLNHIDFFRWGASNLITYAKGSGKRLFWYLLSLCFLTTLFFNDLAGVLVMTPIVLQVCEQLKLKPMQRYPYLLGGVLIGTAASVPLGIGLGSLMTLSLIPMNLSMYANLIFVPATLGIASMALVLYLSTRGQLPARISAQTSMRPNEVTQADWRLFRICMLIVVTTRAGFFIGSGFGVPTAWIAVVGAALLVAVSQLRFGGGTRKLVAQTPWHILLFAFGMYVIVDGLRQTGLIRYLLSEGSFVYGYSDFISSFFTMGLMTVLSNVVNQYPSLIIATLWLAEMNLPLQSVHILYSAAIIGSIVGALLTPFGTLAALIWLYILRQHHVLISWKNYMKLTVMIIPVGLLVSLFSLYAWTQLIG